MRGREASERLRPVIASASEAIQEPVKEIWIASSLMLLAMTGVWTIEIQQRARCAGHGFMAPCTLVYTA